MCGAPAVDRGRCERHKRPGTTQRGYGEPHRRRRAADELAVKQGRARCWRCLEMIAPNEPWDLGHDDHDRNIYRGPEHANRCNRSAAKRNTTR